MSSAPRPHVGATVAAITIGGAECGILFCIIIGVGEKDLTKFNKIAIQGAPQMAVDKEAISLSRVYSYYSKCNLPLFYV